MPGDLEQAFPAVKAWGGTGIIARIPTAHIGKAILRSGVPTIAVDLGEEQLDSANPLSRLPELYVNSRAVGVAAAEHLLERKLLHYGYVREMYNVLWSQRREQAFRRRLARAGFSCQVYEEPPPSVRKWGFEQRRLAKWLRRVPKPIGLLAAMDVRGRQVAEVCQECGLSVPQDVAVLGVDNDELLCELCDPPISSIALDTKLGGYKAAALLDRMMSDRKWKPKRIRIEPTHVVTRQSTDAFFLSDELVVEAVHFMQHNATHLIQVNDVAAHVGLARRSLEIRFRRAMGYSVHSMITNLRLKNVKALLVDTSLPLRRIASASGFANPSYLCKVFRRKFGVTPHEFREQTSVS